MKLILIGRPGTACESDRAVQFDHDGGTLGAAPDNDLVLSAVDGNVAPRQASVVRGRGEWRLRNEGQRFVVVNGRWLECGAERALADHDIIEIGDHVLMVEDTGLAKEAAEAEVLPPPSSAPADNPLRAYPADEPGVPASPLDERAGAGLDPAELLNTPLDPLSLFPSAGHSVGGTGLDLFDPGEPLSPLDPTATAFAAEAPRASDAGFGLRAVQDTMPEFSGPMQIRIADQAAAAEAPPLRDESGLAAALQAFAIETVPSAVADEVAPRGASATPATSSSDAAQQAAGPHESMPSETTPASTPRIGAALIASLGTPLAAPAAARFAAAPPVTATAPELVEQHCSLARAFLEGAGADIHVAQDQYSLDFMHRLGGLVRNLRTLAGAGG
ncbi:FHA domain-containing protein [Lysobacter antibioticus]|uniref:FHA domain-containing protein n=1 Tax=Lysobacter antibioticus TaxID=84531 RepID=UPI00034B9158|nr:FHA domain-containing protein [Lysobacter antibioticus]